jgi:hypothetical protein
VIKQGARAYPGTGHDLSDYDSSFIFDPDAKLCYMIRIPAHEGRLLETIL